MREDYKKGGKTKDSRLKRAGVQSDDELDEYTKGVSKRVNKLTQRAKEAEQRAQYLEQVAAQKDADRQMEYVQSVLKGVEKPEALKTHFPELYELALERAKGNDRVVKANITSQINTLERKAGVKKMYEVAHKHAWTNFVAKKHKLYENLYDMAIRS